jgi:regulator of protease activity HflC (stomatin/prohibitin superfamily)
VLLVVGVAGYAASRYANSLGGQAAMVFVGLGSLIAAVSWFQMRLEDRERLEKMEFDEMTKTGGASSLFNTQEVEAFPARRAREQFERYFVPGFTVLLLLLEGGAAWWLWNWLARPATVALQQPLVAMALLGLLALILFMVGKYSAGIARLEKERLLAPGSSWLLLGSYLLALVVAGVAFVQAGFPNVDLYLGRALCGLLAVSALESFFGLVLELYRPRVKGKVARVLYESRLVSLLSHPEDVFTTAAHALDYQFGFKVSETWFFRFLQKAFAWLILFQLAILLASTAVVFIEAGEEGLLERFGRPLGDGVIGPGAHFKLPWPIDQVHRFRTQEIQTFSVGFVHDEKTEHEAKLLLWTIKHYKEEYHLLVASRETNAIASTSTNAAARKIPPVNLLSVSVPVQYQISDLRAWAYNHAKADKLLEEIASRELVLYLVSADLHEIMSSGRFAAAEELRRRIEARANEEKLGVKIVFVGLQDAHPPVQVAASYEAVAGARQKREANLLAAEAHKIRTNALAGAEAVRKKRTAEAERQRTVSVALARAAQFTNQMAAFHASPDVYSQRAYLQTLSRGGGSARKFILATTNTQDVLLLNLEEKVRADIFDVPLPVAKPKPNPSAGSP